MFGPGPSFLGMPDLYKTILLLVSSPHWHNIPGRKVSAYASGQQLSRNGPGSPNPSSSLPYRVGGPSPPTGCCLHSPLFIDTPLPLLFRPHKIHLQHLCDYLLISWEKRQEDLRQIDLETSFSGI